MTGITKTAKDWLLNLETQTLTDELKHDIADRFQDEHRDLLTVAQLVHKTCGIQANLLSTASDSERREFIRIIYSICNEIVVPALDHAIAKAEGDAP